MSTVTLEEKQGKTKQINKIRLHLPSSPTAARRWKLETIKIKLDHQLNTRILEHFLTISMKQKPYGKGRGAAGISQECSSQKTTLLPTALGYWFLWVLKFWFFSSAYCCPPASDCFIRKITYQYMRQLVWSVCMWCVWVGREQHA